MKVLSSETVAWLAREAGDIEDRLVKVRRDLHQNPEIGLQLPWTQQYVLEELRAFEDLEVTVGNQTSSVTAVLRGAKTPRNGRGYAVLLRGDMDGLPIDEKTGLDFASLTGTMHACGHDLHVATLLGAVHLLYQLRDHLDVDIVFMFQPGEEGYGGAKVMLDEGLMQAAGVPIRHAYSFHVFSGNMRPGHFYTKSGSLMSGSDTASVRVIGKGGHGASPHKASDPVPVACEIVLALQTMVTRKFDIFDPVIVTAGSIRAGDAGNVIPEHATLELSLRSFSAKSRVRLREAVQELIVNTTRAHGLEATVEFGVPYPPLVIPDDEAEYSAQTLAEVFGHDRFSFRDVPLAGSEDFAYVLEQVPGSFVLLGVGVDEESFDSSPMNHSAYAQFDDRYLADSAVALASLALGRAQLLER